MIHNTTEILNQLAELAESYPFDKSEHDEADRLMKEFEEAILHKLTERETLEITLRLFMLKEPQKRKYKKTTEL